MNELYESYHRFRSVQRRIIDKNDFTYHVALGLLEEYGIENKRVLDIGCGVGTIDFYLVKKGASYVLGIDISENGIKAAVLNKYNLGIGNKLNFKVINFPNTVPKNKFDIIICLEVLEHLKEDQKAINRMVRLLNRNGIIFASSPSKNSLLFRIGLLDTFDKRVGHLRRYSESSFKRHFEKEKLEILEVKRVQGIIRDFLFTTSLGGLLLKFVNKLRISRVVTYLDDFAAKIFGESDIYIVAQKK